MLDVSKLKKYKQFLELKDSLTHKEISNIVASIKKLHADRPSRKLTNFKNSENVVKASLTDQAYRSSILEQVDCVRYYYSKLETAHNLFVNYLCTEPTLASQIPNRSRADKIAWLESNILGLSESLHLLNAANGCVELADYIIEDIDKMAWSLKLAIQSLEMFFKER